MPTFWELLRNNDSDAQRPTGDGIDSYEVDNSEIRRMGLVFKGRNANGDRIWVDSVGREYVSEQIAKKDSNGSIQRQTPTGVRNNNWEMYKQPQTPTNYVPPVIKFPVPDTAKYMPGLESWNTVTNQFLHVDQLQNATSQFKSSMPQIVQGQFVDENNDVIVDTIFISSHSGKFLGEIKDFIEPDPDHITFKKEKLSIRSIDDVDWKDLNRLKAGNDTVIAEGQGEISYLLLSKKIQANFEQLHNDVETITTKKVRDGISIERHLIIFFDKETNEFISIIQDDSKNKNDSSYISLNDDKYNGSIFKVSKKNRNQIALAIVHTHPYLNQEFSAPGTTVTNFKERRNARGMSPEDIESANKDKLTDYAIETYTKPVLVSCVIPGQAQKIDFTSLNDILNSDFNLFLDAIKNYISCHV